MSSTKRRISSCIPCYTRKQKCNRECPCNHCSRRQCAEDCVYYYPPNSNLNARTVSQSPTPATLAEHPTGERSKESLLARAADSEPLNAQQHGGQEWHLETKLAVPQTVPARSGSGLSLAESFGYFEGSSRNSLALAIKLGLGVWDPSPKSLVADAVKEVHRAAERMPDRKTLDFLVQYFIAEVNWMEQLAHVPWFLPKYQRWRVADALVADLDFTILVLRICSYASSFLPSPTYTLDKIHGILLSDIRRICEGVADNLEAISTAADSRGSVVRVQHLLLLGVQHQVEGKIKAFWEVLSRAVRVAQDVGMDRVVPSSTLKGSEKFDVEKEMERRTLCNLYICDSVLSRQLDRTPFLRGPLPPETRPHLHVHPVERRRESMVSDDAGGGGILEAPDPFTGRLLQADLADFWRRATSKQTADYDMVAAEDCDERFYREFVLQLPPAFAVTEPDKTWDRRHPKLPLQRKLLHMAIYDSMCWNLRPLMLRQPEPSLPAYKSVMLSCQKRKIAAAALHSLEAAAHLHVLLGSCHTRAAAIISSTFEATVILVCLATDPTFPDAQRQEQAPDPLLARIGTVSRAACAAAIKAALRRLQMLAEASNLAEVAANSLSRLLKVNSHALGSDFNLGSGEMAMVQGEAVLCSGPVATPHSSIGSLLTEGETDHIRTTQSTNSEMGAVSTTGGMSSWSHGSLADLGLVNDMLSSSNSTVVEGDISGWTGFETSNMNEVWAGYTGDGPLPEWNFSQ